MKRGAAAILCAVSLVGAAVAAGLKFEPAA